MKMLNNGSIVELIERAHNDRPYCECGRNTTPIYRDNAVWLECAIVNEPVTGRARRLWAAVTAPGHVHRHLIDVVPADQLAA